MIEKAWKPKTFVSTLKVHCDVVQHTVSTHSQECARLIDRASLAREGGRAKLAFQEGQLMTRCGDFPSTCHQMRQFCVAWRSLEMTSDWREKTSPCRGVALQLLVVCSIFWITELSRTHFLMLNYWYHLSDKAGNDTSWASWLSQVFCFSASTCAFTCFMETCCGLLCMSSRLAFLLLGPWILCPNLPSSGMS